MSEKLVHKKYSAMSGNILLCRPEIVTLSPENDTEIFRPTGRTESEFRYHTAQLIISWIFSDRTWIEEKYFNIISQRTISNQFLFKNTPVIVVYLDINSGMTRIINYVKKRITAAVTETGDKFKDGVKIAVSEKHDFVDELQRCGFDFQGKKFNW